MPREPVHRWDDFFLNGPQASDEFLPARASQTDARREPLEDGSPPHETRQGWAEAARQLAGQGEDALLMGEFGNAGDAKPSR